MHSDSIEPSEGAAQVVSRGVSAAEKRDEYERLGLEWPKYPDGSDQRWQLRTKGGNWRSWSVVKEDREKHRRRHAQLRLEPGVCGQSKCNKPKYRSRTGTYEPYCRDHKALRWRKRLGWYEKEGMATKPTQFKELTNE